MYSCWSKNFISENYRSVCKLTYFPMGLMSSCAKIQIDEDVFRVTDRQTLTESRHDKMVFVAKHCRWFNQRANKQVSPSSAEIVFDTAKEQVRPFHLSYWLHVSGLGSLHFTSLRHQPFSELIKLMHESRGKVKRSPNTIKRSKE
jgi:hypothetical protein